VVGNPGSVVSSVRMNRRNGEWEEDTVRGKGQGVRCQWGNESELNLVGVHNPGRLWRCPRQVNFSCVLVF